MKNERKLEKYKKKNPKKRLGRQDLKNQESPEKRIKTAKKIKRENSQ